MHRLWYLATDRHALLFFFERRGNLNSSEYMNTKVRVFPHTIVAERVNKLTGINLPVSGFTLV